MQDTYTNKPDQANDFTCVWLTTKGEDYMYTYKCRVYSSTHTHAYAHTHIHIPTPHIHPHTHTHTHTHSHIHTHIRAHITCRRDSLNKFHYLLHICCEGQDLGNIGIAIAVVTMGNDCNTDTRNLLLKALHSISNVATDLQLYIWNKEVN